MIEINNEVFLISDNVIFNPLQRTLYLKGQHERHIMQTPASMCLVLLLRNHGELVTRDELINFAWGEGATVYVTSNTFYQTISHLRKMLDAVGHGAMVTTIPRLGITVGKEYQITVCASDDITTIKEHELTDTQRLSRRRRQAGFMVLTCLMLFMFPLAIVQLLQRNHDVFANWPTLPGQNCEVRYTGTDDQQTIIDVMASNQVSCEHNSHIFVNINPRVMRYSLLTCQVYNADKQRCQSLLVGGGHRE